MSGRRIYFSLRQKLNHFLNPALCLACGISVKPDDFICHYCLKSLERVQNPCCLCGLPNKSTGSICPPCLHNPPKWQKMIAPLSYSGYTRQLISEFKFNEKLHYAHALLTHIHSYYRERPVQALLPIPLHKSRLLERGYNQSEEVASELSQLLHIELDRSSLIRVKPTQPQSGLSLNKRQLNIRKAFKYTPIHEYRSVAVIDDIITTGSTVLEVCKVLNRAGVQHVEVWSLARALKHD